MTVYFGYALVCVRALHMKLFLGIIYDPLKPRDGPFVG